MPYATRNSTPQPTALPGGPFLPSFLLSIKLTVAHTLTGFSSDKDDDDVHPPPPTRTASSRVPLQPQLLALHCTRCSSQAWVPASRRQEDE